MSSFGITPRPDGAKWKKAELYKVDLYDSRWPVCGTRLIWAIVGWKHVYCCVPVSNQKWRMKRTDWNKLPLTDKNYKQTRNCSQSKGEANESTGILEFA